MRYEPRNRIKFPDPEDSKLWTALDAIEIPYDKVPSVRPPTARITQNYYAAAKVYYNNKNDYGLVDYQEHIKRSNKQSRLSKQKRLDYWQNIGIPILLVSRQWSSQEMKIHIKKWINKINFKN